MHYWEKPQQVPSVITIFSAPNYCDVYKNKAAVLKIKVRYYLWGCNAFLGRMITSVSRISMKLSTRFCCQAALTYSSFRFLTWLRKYSTCFTALSHMKNTNKEMRKRWVLKTCRRFLWGNARNWMRPKSWRSECKPSAECEACTRTCSKTMTYCLRLKWLTMVESRKDCF